MAAARSVMRVAVVTGSRAEYGIWRPVLRAILAEPQLALHLVVTGMHLLPTFGSTWRQITADGFTIAARAPMYAAGRRSAADPLATPLALARGTASLARAFETLDCPIVLVLGDRLEMLAAASAALAGQRILVHIHGGETAPGQFDEQIRHAITKMAHWHCAATPAAAQRIIQMGEAAERVQVCGAPALDELIAYAATLPKAEPARPKPPLLVLHPASPDDIKEERQARLILRALARCFPMPIEVIGPNNDPGHQGILRAYQQAAGAIRLRMNLAQQEFWHVLATSRLLIGNSSAGIIEAASLGVPVVNIGPRQAGRERNCNVIDAPANIRQLQTALAKALSDPAYLREVARRNNIYGDGHAARRIVNMLRQINPDRLERAKRFVDLQAAESSQPGRVIKNQH